MAITLTEKAAKHINRYIERRGKGIGLRFGVRTTGCSGLAYKLEYVDEVSDEDSVFESHGVKVFVDPKSLPYIDGTELDFARHVDEAPKTEVQVRLVDGRVFPVAGSITWPSAQRSSTCTGAPQPGCSTCTGGPSGPARCASPHSNIARMTGRRSQPAAVSRYSCRSRAPGSR